MAARGSIFQATGIHPPPPRLEWVVRGWNATQVVLTRQVATWEQPVDCNLISKSSAKAGRLSYRSERAGEASGEHKPHEQATGAPMRLVA